MADGIAPGETDEGDGVRPDSGGEVRSRPAAGDSAVCTDGGTGSGEVMSLSAGNGDLADCERIASDCSKVGRNGCEY